ncbi:glutamate-gated chloride channel-like [Amblyomma americanum]|uniref:Gamma-aminobutyric acid receptor subunit beta n=1 Tax=Amblyomma americanum TaxID=6943 RepID=A0AAQ4E4T4_AMBAM
MCLRSSLLWLGFLVLNGAASSRMYSRERHIGILNTIFEKNAYDSSMRPPAVNGTGPVRVEVSMFVLSIPEVSEKHMDYTMQVYFRQSWVDPRLQFDDRAGDVEYLNLYQADKIWRPDAFFANEKEGYFHHVPRPNSFVRIFPTGRVLYSTRLTLTLSCLMNLKKYPFDSQSCAIIIPSYGYTTDDIIFAYKQHNAVMIDKSVALRDYKITGFIQGSCTSRTNTGDYSCLRADFWFRRLTRSLDVLVFIPCAMYVVLSWMPLWLDNTGAAKRTRLVVPALVLVAMGSTLSRLRHSEFPQTAYTKAVDVWTGVTLAFVLAVWIDLGLVALLAGRSPSGAGKAAAQETATVNDECFGKAEHLELLEMDTKDNASNGPLRNTGQGNWKTTVQNWLSSPRTTADKLDLVSRILFPAAFFLFVVIYIRTYVVELDVPED